MATLKKINEQVNYDSIKLIEGKVKKSNSSGHDFYWHIYANAVRAGQVYIDFVENPVLGRHAAINIFLNQKSQSKGIGRIGYEQACKKSNLDTVYAHMRKNNLASKKAAKAAGFTEITDERFNQVVMIWHNKK